MAIKRDTLAKITAGIGMVPCVIYFLNLVLTVAPGFLVVYAGLFLYGICKAGKRQ